MRRIIGLCLGVALMAASAFAGGTKEEAEAIVSKAMDFLKANGPEKAIAAFSDPKGEFVKGDLYIFWMKNDGTMLAHGSNAKLIGKNIYEMKDPDGKEFIKEFAVVAKKGGGWVDYKWANPETKKVQSKSSFLKPVEGQDSYLGCGIYK